MTRGSSAGRLQYSRISGILVRNRCWKSKKFPYCDGAHAKHNAETGDNVGPLIVKKSS